MLTDKEVFKILKDNYNVIRRMANKMTLDQDRSSYEDAQSIAYIESYNYLKKFFTPDKGMKPSTFMISYVYQRAKNKYLRTQSIVSAPINTIKNDGIFDYNSIYSTIDKGAEKGNEYIDTIEDNKSNKFYIVDGYDTINYIKKIVEEKFNKRDSRIFFKRFGFNNNYECKVLKDIAKEENMDFRNVDRINKMIIKTIKKEIVNKGVIL